MADASAAVKKSVTIDPAVLERLSRQRRANLSATVNESLRLLAALDAQRSLVEEWEAEHGAFSEEELRPYLEAVLQADMESELSRAGLGRKSERRAG
jgi:hypothetical protein